MDRILKSIEGTLKALYRATERAITIDQQKEFARQYCELESRKWDLVFGSAV